MLRKFAKKSDFNVHIQPPANSPVFGLYDKWVSYSGCNEWVLPQGCRPHQVDRIRSSQRGLSSLELARWERNTFILISFLGDLNRSYYLSSLKAHLQAADCHQLLNDEKLLLIIKNNEDLSHALSVLNQRHQLDPDTRDDLEAVLQIKIALSTFDAKLYLLQGRFDEVYADCLTQSSYFCDKVGNHARKHYYQQHPDWSIKFYLAARMDEKDKFYFGYAYCFALRAISELLLSGHEIDYNVFDHISFDELFKVLTEPSQPHRSTHHDFIYFLGIYCREMHSDHIDWAIQCFRAVPEGDKHYPHACDALLHLEMQGHCTADIPGSEIDKDERMLRYALLGIPENRWMAQMYFAKLSGTADISMILPGLTANVDSVVAMAKQIRQLHEENAQLRNRLLTLESELKKYKADDAGVAVSVPRLFK